jgi:Flp pilus assembly protein CpaB
MEMEYKDNNRRGKFVIIAGVVLAIVAGAASFYLISQARNETPGETTLVDVVVAAQAIPARTPIAPGAVIVRKVPLDAATQVGVATDPSKLVGQVLAVPVAIGQPIYLNMIASASGQSGFSILGPDETITPESEAWRAVSVSVTDDRAVGGMLGPGMFVDVFMTASVNVPQSVLDEGTYYTDQSTKLSWQNMEILSRQGTFYIVKATLPIAEEISHLQAAGNAQFSMALRPDVDTRVLDVSALGATTNRIIQRYGLPVPESYPKGDGPIASAPPIPAITPAPSSSPSPSGSAQPSPGASATP